MQQPTAPANDSGSPAHDHSHDGDHSGHDHDSHASSDAAPVKTLPADIALGGRSFKIQGMDCADEVAILKQAVGPVVGGADRLSFDVLNGRMTVPPRAATTPDDAVFKAVAGTGMKAAQWNSQASRKESNSHRRQQVLFTVLSGASLLFGLVLHAIPTSGLDEAFRLFLDHSTAPMPWYEIAAYLAAILLGARFVVVKAWYAARNLRPDINLLMVIAVAGAIGIGEWVEGATVAFLFALSLALEGWSVGRARRAIEALLDLAPPTVKLVKADGTEVEVPAADVQPGNRFLVPGGERIALDGRVVSGTSAVNQAPITGESIPVEKHEGQDVYAGTINGDGTLVVEATKAANDTTLARIIRMVEEAHSRRAPAELWVERFARIYTPAVMVIALAVFLVPPLLFGGGWEDWLYRALVLLVIACPCALVISTPVSIVASLAASARAGVLVKGGAYVELPARLRAFAVDKTGTITRGEPEVVAVLPRPGRSNADLLAMAGALEARSTHPLARAILRKAESSRVVVDAARDVRVLQGRGLQGRIGESLFWLGSSRYVVERDQNDPEIALRAGEQEALGRTVIVVGNEQEVWGLIAVADTVRPEAKAMVAELHAAGIQHVVMLTGDNRVTAEAIAREVGIDEVHAELLPDDKLRKVEELVQKYGTVAMVGDGVNDAPALARASLGIAMGAIGSDAAIETADIALMTDDVSRLSWLVHHAKRTLAIIRQNIIFSLGVKVIFFVLTFAGLASLWGAIAADVGASLLVVFNALRLLRVEGAPAKPPAAVRV